MQTAKYCFIVRQAFLRYGFFEAIDFSDSLKSQIFNLRYLPNEVKKKYNSDKEVTENTCTCFKKWKTCIWITGNGMLLPFSFRCPPRYLSRFFSLEKSLFLPNLLSEVVSQDYKRLSVCCKFKKNPTAWIVSVDMESTSR